MSLERNGTENPAITNRLMEEVCERENLKAALQQVKANKGSAGVDGMTVADPIRTALRAAGRIDTKSCAVSQTLSATRYAARKG